MLVNLINQNNEFYVVGLYDNNADCYRKVKGAYNSGEQIVGIVHATGTGKSYNAIQLSYYYKKEKNYMFYHITL